MKISYNWLKEFVKFSLSPEALADKLALSGLAVAGVEKVGGDTVIELEITANRADCLSMIGVAQEVAAITGAKAKLTVKPPKLFLKKSKEIFLKPRSVVLENTKDCLFYRAALITGVKVGQSPAWLRDRIESLGIRSINNIVDITNYCLLEYGQPLHGFDFDKLNEKIIVRRATNGEKLTFLDGVARELNNSMLVIADAKRAVALAGVMGGADTEISATTKNVLLESASFNFILVRRASRALGVPTEASYRFERGIAFDRLMQGQDRAVELMCSVAGGTYVDVQAAGIKPKKTSVTVALDCNKLNTMLSLRLSKSTVKTICGSLGFSVKEAGKNSLKVTVPGLRRDIAIEEDVIEEISRVYGYAKMPSTLPAIRSVHIDNAKSETLKIKVRETLCALGFDEAITYSLLSKQLLEATRCNGDLAKLWNPLSSEQEYLRPMLAPNMFQALARNINRANYDVHLFEIGHVFKKSDHESLSVGIVLCGALVDNWQMEKEANLFALKGAVKKFICLSGFGHVVFAGTNDGPNFLFEKIAVLCEGKTLGFLGEVDPAIVEAHGIKKPPRVFYAELSLSLLSECTPLEKQFVPLPLFPSIRRDLSLAVKQSVAYAQIEKIIRSEAGALLKTTHLVDVYTGKQIAEGRRGLTFSLEFSTDERTLTDEEVNVIHNRITAALKQKLDIDIR